FSPTFLPLVDAGNVKPRSITRSLADQPRLPDFTLAGLVPLRQTFVRRCQNCVACPLSGLQKPTVGGSPRWFPWVASPTSRAAKVFFELRSLARASMNEMDGDRVQTAVR